MAVSTPCSCPSSELRSGRETSTYQAQGERFCVSSPPPVPRRLVVRVALQGTGGCGRWERSLWKVQVLISERAADPDSPQRGPPRMLVPGALVVSAGRPALRREAPSGCPPGPHPASYASSPTGRVMSGPPVGIAAGRAVGRLLECPAAREPGQPRLACILLSPCQNRS